jgi:hypothetical protein
MTRMNIQHSTFNAQHPAFAHRDVIRCSKSNVKCWMFSLSFAITALPLFAQSSASLDDDSPKLLPPYGELPLTFWEQHGLSVLIAGIVLAVIASCIVWWVRRPKPEPIVPPEVRARAALTALLHQSEDGNLLSNVSQILRRYVIAAFELPPGEPTTSEFCRTIESNDNIGQELSAKLANFLRECDERKFSAQNLAEPMRAASSALELVDVAESHRAKLRQFDGSREQPATLARA